MATQSLFISIFFTSVSTMRNSSPLASRATLCCSRAHLLSRAATSFSKKGRRRSDPEILLNAITRYHKFLPGKQQQAFLEDLRQQVS